MIEIVDSGPGTTVQDLGRAGWEHIGVPSSGALDRSAFIAANRAVGNPEGSAAIEVVLGGLTLRALDRHVVCLTGAPVPGLAHGEPIVLEPGDELRLASPSEGLRTYVAVAGGIDVVRVLGSASWDSLSHLGTPPLVAGQVVSIGEPVGRPNAIDPVLMRPFDGVVRVWPGPRHAWFHDGLAHLCEHAWTVSSDLNRVGLRLGGAPLRRAIQGELPSEGIVTGAVQIPHDGLPIVMLADHPTTGGYPVVAVVDPRDLDHLAQVRPGDRLRFRHAAREQSG